MIHFFQPTQRDNAHLNAAASGATLSELLIRPGATAKVGLRGGRLEALDLRVFRYGTWVSGSPSSPVKLARTMDDVGQNIQVYTVSGLRDGDTLVGWRFADNRPGTEELPVIELWNTPSGQMREAASWYGIRGPYQNRAICSLAVPYLALSDAKMGSMTVLNDANAGGPLMSVHGLAVHTTAGVDTRPPYYMARWGCVETWNGGGYGASAHFGVAGDGTLVQFLPVNYVANAQYNPGNQHWISVEVDNNGKTPMNDRQLTSVKSLFWWVCNNFGIPRQLATGCLFPKSPDFDKQTIEVCARAKVATTTDPYEACMSRGLSCHWWLEGNKTTNSHGCPGAGIMNQLDALVRV